MIDKRMKQILDIGISFSKMKNRDVLLDQILTEAIELTHCDAGTLYINNGEELEFKIMITISNGTHQGGSGSEISMPPVPLAKENVCAYAALYRRLYNIPDVYQSDEFDFSGPKKYDAITGYKTTSMMVVPMEDDKENVIGVMQLINALDDAGNVIPFHVDYENILLSMGSQAAICLVNMNYSRQIEGMLKSFVSAMSVAVDERSPYNANHTKSMVGYAKRFIRWLNEQTDIAWKFSDEDEQIFLMSVWLHDIGKLVTHNDVIDKGDRLGRDKVLVDARLDKISLITHIDALEGRISLETEKQVQDCIEATRVFLERANVVGYLDDEMYEQVLKIAAYTYREAGEEKPWLTQSEIEELTIRNGTLTKREREIMQNHVVVTRKLLEQISFEGKYKKVIEWAGNHHEFLNGTGYPAGLKGDEIEPEVRLLTIVDIFDALTAEDRPYKPPMPKERALMVLEKMAAEGELDAQIVDWFRKSSAWINNDDMV